jgi:hypothetical protein
MKKPMLNAALGLAALLAVGSSGHAFAATYDFSYTFLDGGTPGGGAGAEAGTVTGQFTGTGPISDITNISNISLSLNGTAMTGPFFAWTYNGPANTPGFPGAFTLGNATISSDATKNDFLFTNAASTSDSPGNYFYIIQPWNNPGPGSTTIATQLVNNGITIDNYNGQYVTENWSITAVPEPATWAMLILGMGAMGAVLRQRRNDSFVPA